MRRQVTGPSGQEADPFPRAGGQGPPWREFLFRAMLEHPVRFSRRRPLLDHREVQVPGLAELVDGELHLALHAPVNANVRGRLLERFADGPRERPRPVQIGAEVADKIRAGQPC
jgi:hypothetical protein